MRRWLIGARPRTLAAAVVPVVVGTAAAVGRVPGGLVWWRAGAALIVAVAIQVATNFQNDYADGVRGADTHRVGPTRLVGSGLATPAEVRRATVVAALVAAGAGLALALAVGPELLVVGAVSLAAGYFYTGGPRPYGYAGLGEVFVFVFFGVVATVGSSYVQSESVTLLAVAVSMPVGFLATLILVVNNLRDISSDTAVGKRTLAVRMGDGSTRSLAVVLVVAAYACLVAIAVVRPLALLALVSLPVAVRVVRVITSGATGPKLIGALGASARLELVFGLALGAGLALSA